MKTQAETPRVPESETVCVPWEVLTASAEQALSNRDFGEAETMALAALEEAESFAASDGRLAMTLESLAEIYYLQQKYTLAAPICRRLIALYSKTLGEDHLDTGIIAHNLAMIYHSAGKLVQAEPLYKQALAIKTKALGSKHPQVLTLLGHYTTLLFQTNRAAEAEALRASAVAISNGRFSRSGRWEAM
ncbi:MAG TPA: tetratricopeptide repeat protein [Drouetiella sp.]